MKTTVSLPGPLFEAADELAKRLGISRDELYAIAIAEYLRAYQREAVTEGLNRIYEQEPSGLDPVVAVIQPASLGEEDW
jgi:metal-responsive CopG/Arc/MetJ family transcriptional regulator